MPLHVFVETALVILFFVLVFLLLYVIEVGICFSPFASTEIVMLSLF